jgi:hypothetical protein
MRSNACAPGALCGLVIASRLPRPVARRARDRGHQAYFEVFFAFDLWGLYFRVQKLDWSKAMPDRLDAAWTAFEKLSAGERREFIRLLAADEAAKREARRRAHGTDSGYRAPRDHLGKVLGLVNPACITDYPLKAAPLEATRPT